MGLPCYYTLYQRKLSTSVVHLKDIHVHWHYSRPEPGSFSMPALPVLNPLIVKGKVRPRGALGTRSRVAPTSTQRDPSSFELPSSSAPPVLNRLTTEQLYVPYLLAYKTPLRYKTPSHIRLPQAERRCKICMAHRPSTIVNPFAIRPPLREGICLARAT
jgi:hypothetical protein